MMRLAPSFRRGVVLSLPLLSLLIPHGALATPTDNEEVITRRGGIIGGTGTEKPTIKLTKPEAGWSVNYQVEVEGSCSDATADPVEININGVRYYARTSEGHFNKKFPAAPGRNNVVALCRNKGGVGRFETWVHSTAAPTALKVVLTSDTDNVYTDLHIYEPDGHHVYWASTQSPSGGIFFLNSQGGSDDQPGYGPYLFVHPSPPKGVFKIEANYWPGGAIRHTAANLDLVFDEGLPSEARRRIRQPLARPNETRTLAYVVVRPNRLPPIIFVPGQDDEAKKPAEIAEYDAKLAEIKKQSGEGEENADEESEEETEAFLSPTDEESMRLALTELALAQAKSPSPLWEPSQRDCAGLVRFVYREALRTRTAAQRVKLGVPSRLRFPAVSPAARALFPAYPSIWEAGLTSHGSPFFAPFADSEVLLSYSFAPLPAAPAEARPGDLLAFKKDLQDVVPSHLMLVASRRPDGLVVYHNGAAGRDGAVRVVSVDELLHSPDVTWVPVRENPHFLGVYRWKHFARNV